MEQQLTHWKKLHNPNYLGAYSLMNGDEKTELIVTIQEVKTEQVQGEDGKKEQCMVAYLIGQKPMIVNPTNSKAITKALGTPYVEQWVGKSITLCVKKVKAFGETTDALRVKDTAPVQALPELNESHPKWNDAKKAIADKTATIDQIRSKFFLTPQNEQLLYAASL